MLEQARLALYTRNSVLYRDSLGNIAAELERHAYTETRAGREAAAELAELAAVDINPELPTLSRTMALVAQLMETEIQD